ncbi:flagellar basal body rod protein FlgB [Actinomarinicola tropica]|uniref:Flagellar basal body rod protein FlgB n=1 Tax=Actinomarinicola tropica TaxID=2789776 RepID=A0A5Q2RLA7_9ACTN|nr:flagellar biosynthesis protein FlgB [Actinomarinicola tropica]QGG94640.1 flagellar biosynthesis protein FlgB [Actinomarinicola tropica]
MIVSDATMRALHTALTGLNARRQAAEDNIANVETAGYTAKKVDFEDSLRTAIERGEPRAVDISVTRSLAPTRMNGNNVAIDEEMVGLTETALRHQLVVEGMNTKFRLLRTSIVGQ